MYKKRKIDLFYIPPDQQKTLFILITLFLCFITVKSGLNIYFHKKYEKQEEYLQDQALLEQWLKELTPMLSENNKACQSLIPINKANVEELINIPHITKPLAERIIRYKELLGGFVSTKQYQDIYHITQKQREALNKYTSIASREELKKINVNTASYKELIKHPYLGKEEVKKILYYRKQHNQFTKLNELLTERILTEKKYQQIKPYLTT